ncbi:hypothetical protein D7V86_06535 [bacterium D16-51]|nr:hypothetical protein D7V96_03375 [bacterium D16-59]RKI61172.1 hypothetical protein D7V86_06535 [bacterium D16-51]
MHKLVIVINGSGGVGKDTICNIVGKHYRTMNISSVDPIKKIASENGWDGGKNEKSRKFLADLKQLFVDFNDLPCKYLLGKYQEFLESSNEILFVHIREPEEISKFKKSVQKSCITLLIRRTSHTKKEWNNTADDNVEHFNYDFYYDNIKPYGEIENDFLAFFNSILEKNGS